MDGSCLFVKDVTMQTVAADEKATTILVYTHNALIRGELVTKQNARVSIWLRMQSEVHYLHIRKPQILMFGGPLTKSMINDEFYCPIAQIYGFHLAPPANEPLDYDSSEPNRAMKEVNLLLGDFTVKGKLRISTHADLATTIEVAHTGWLSVYDVEVAPLFVPSFPVMQAPMMLVNPRVVNFGV
jgi:hypothetical protein